MRWFTRTSPQGEAPLPILTSAGITHLSSDSIHPLRKSAVPRRRAGLPPTKARFQDALARGTSQAILPPGRMRPPYAARELALRNTTRSVAACRRTALS
jgi:hypothetical protein